jgi:hypothetical protein
VPDDTELPTGARKGHVGASAPLPPGVERPVTGFARWAIWALIVWLSAACVYEARQADPDLFGHLAYGRLFVEGGGPTGTDPFAFTTAGRPWVAFEYLAQELLWMAYHSVGPLGLIALKCALGGAAIFFLWVAIRATTGNLLVWAPVFLLCASSVGRFFLFRPQLFTYACFALFVAVLFRFLLRRGAALWILPPVMLLWANTHGGFVAGLGAMALVLALRLSASFHAGERVATAVGQNKSLILSLGACCAATFVSPWGIALWRYVLTELLHGTNRRYISEWMPASLQRDPWSWTALAAITGTLAAVGWMAHRRKCEVAGLKAWQWTASASPLILLAYWSDRHAPLAAIWSAPVIAVLADAASRPVPTPAFRRVWLAFSSVALVMISLTADYVLEHPALVIATGGTTLGTRDPCRAVAFIRENHLTGNVYTPLWWGSYVTWETYPAVRVSMDGRNISVFPDAAVGANLRFYSGGATADDLLDPLRYATDFLLVPSDAAILELVRSDGRWKEVYRDGDASVFVRADAAHAKVVGSFKAGTLAPLVGCPVRTLR